jgi:hypothetical protein
MSVLCLRRRSNELDTNRQWRSADIRPSRRQRMFLVAGQSHRPGPSPAASDACGHARIKSGHDVLVPGAPPIPVPVGGCLWGSDRPPTTLLDYTRNVPFIVVLVPRSRAVTVAAFFPAVMVPEPTGFPAFVAPPLVRPAARATAVSIPVDRLNRSQSAGRTIRMRGCSQSQGTEQRQSQNRVTHVFPPSTLFQLGSG